jgi:hypothetical protein
MLTALVASVIFGAFGWVAAWHARGEALASDRDALAADERSRIAEAKTSGIQLTDTALRNTVSALQEQLAIERMQRSSMQLEVAKLRADLQAAQVDTDPSAGLPWREGEELYHSTTKRLRIPAALVTRRPA